MAGPDTWSVLGSTGPTGRSGPIFRTMVQTQAPILPTAPTKPTSINSFHGFYQTHPPTRMVTTTPPSVSTTTPSTVLFSAVETSPLTLAKTVFPPLRNKCFNTVPWRRAQSFGSRTAWCVTQTSTSSP